MKVKLRAYKSDNEKDGETIVFDVNGYSVVCCAWDIDRLIDKLREARDCALQADVGDESREFTLGL